MVKVRVLIAEDHGIVRDGIRSLLQSQLDMEVVGEAANGLTAIEQTLTLQPEVVLMDLGMPGLSGIEATRQIHKRCPQAKVLALTVHDSDEYFYRALDAGASGYVLKEAPSCDLLHAIRVVCRGDIYLGPSFSERLVGDYLRRVKRGDENDSYSTLTDREREVLHLIAEGMANHEIASALSLSPSTVHTYLSRIMEKLSLRTRADLIKYAIRRGIIDVAT